MTVSASTKHPQFTKMQSVWQKMIDAYEGEDTIKEKGAIYLPMTESMVSEGQRGLKAYNAYKQRAEFPDFLTDAVDSILGKLIREEAVIDLPSKLEFMRENATANGESLQDLVKGIFKREVLTGRVGLLLDQTNNLPYISVYNEASIINWNKADGEDNEKPYLNLVVLDESGDYLNENLNWVTRQKHRVLTLEDGVYSVREIVGGDYTNLSSVAPIQPRTQMGTLSEIPFVFINVSNTLPDVQFPVLLGLANLCLQIYMKTADYHQNLFMQGQDTPFMAGFSQDELEKNVKIGAMGGVGTTSHDARFEFVGVSGQGLSEQRVALENDRARAGTMSLQIQQSSQKESGEAISLRISAQTSKLKSMALTCAEGLEKILKIAAVWVGANPDEVKVTPNLDFVDDMMTGKDLSDFMAGKHAGALLSYRTLHDIFRQRGLTKKTFEEELAEIEKEEDEGIALTLSGGGVQMTNQTFEAQEPLQQPINDNPQDNNDASA